MGVKVLKKFSVFARSLELKPHHQIQINVIPRTIFLGNVGIFDENDSMVFYGYFMSRY